MANRKKIEAERKWTDVLRTWKASGLKAAAYCRQQQVNPYLFYRWKKRLGYEGRHSSRLPGACLPVKLVAPLVETAGRPWVELALANGRTLRLWREVSPEALGEMAGALERGAC